MELILNKRPKNAVIIEGFPGVGFIGSIATEFLIVHLKSQEADQRKRITNLVWEELNTLYLLNGILWLSNFKAKAPFEFLG